MKREISRLSCSNCGKPLKNRLVEFCPRCNARFSVYKVNFKHLFLMAPIALLMFYAPFYFAFTTNQDFSSRGVKSLEEFNIIMIVVSIIMISTLLVLFFYQRKRLKKSEEYIGIPVNAKIEIKKFEVENDNKLILLLIISFIIILPAFLIPPYYDIKGEIDIFANPILSFFLAVLWIFVIILPFIIGYYTFEKPIKKLYGGD